MQHKRLVVEIRRLKKAKSITTLPDRVETVYQWRLELHTLVTKAFLGAAVSLGIAVLIGAAKNEPSLGEEAIWTLGLGALILAAVGCLRIIEAKQMLSQFLEAINASYI